MTNKRILPVKQVVRNPLVTGNSMRRNWQMQRKSHPHRNLRLVSQFSSVQLLSHVRLFATPWIAARQASLSITNSRSSLRLTSIGLYPILCDPLDCNHQAPLSVGFFRQERVAISFSRVLPNLVMEPASPVSPALQADFFHLMSNGGSP